MKVKRIPNYISGCLLSNEICKKIFRKLAHTLGVGCVMSRGELNNWGIRFTFQMDINEREKKIFSNSLLHF